MIKFTLSMSKPHAKDQHAKYKLSPWRLKIHEIIFEADTPAGKAFDVALIFLILVSLLGMMLESVHEIDTKYDPQLRALDWIITILFTIEYVLRIVATGRPRNYIFSFYGIIDLLSLLPTYIALFVVGIQALSVIRAIRLLRVFRVLKLVQFVGEGSSLLKAIKSSAKKIIVFLLFVLTVCMILGTLMYLIEGKEAGFTSIPISIYWCIVTLTTVGYGDIAPQTPLGQMLASLIMIIGYGVIAVPTGIVGAQIIKGDVKKENFSTQACPECSREGHEADAVHCKFCGAEL